jgi:hypothetical protein
MAKKAAAPKPQTPDSNKQLVDAIITVKRLQDFMGQHGGLERAVSVVAGVEDMVQLTGGFLQLRQALEIVGKVPE